jgi:hypothetical protein
LPSDQAIESLKTPVVIVEVNNEVRGAGFLVSDKGYILTAAHVVSDPKAANRLSLRANVKFHGAAVSEIATVLDGNLVFDLALLKVGPRKQPSAVQFGNSIQFGDSISIHKPQDLTIVGHPLSGGVREWFAHRTLKVSASDSFGRIALSAGSVSDGNSGGPAFSSDGKVVGIVLARSEEVNEGYVLPIHYAQYFLRGVGLDSPHGAFTDYTSELTQLREILTSYARIMHYLKTELEWTMQVERQWKQRRDGSTYTDKVLVVEYDERFTDQFKPEGISLRMFPIFKEVAFNLSEARKTKLYFDVSLLFEGPKLAEVGGIDNFLRGIIEKYNQEHKTGPGARIIGGSDLRLENVEQLYVEIQPTAPKANVTFRKHSQRVPYGKP